MRSRFVALSLLLLAGAGGVQAQSNVEGRVGKLESEMRAVQRKVFPGGAGQYLQPQVEPAVTPRELPGAPATSAIADLSSRVSSLESQLTTLTGQVEQAGFRARQVQEQFDAYRRATDARLKTLEATRPAVAAAEVETGGTELPPPVRAASRPASGATTRPAGGVARPAAAPAASPTPAAADPDRGDRVGAVEKPNTGNAAEDAYTYGYRLWNAKLYTEAQAQLKKAAAAGPSAKSYSRAQNLLGRAYLDDGKPSLASMAFYDNYKKAPDGERAPESLYYLAQALQKLGKPTDACKVYDELSDVYANKLTTRMKADVTTGRTAAKCKAG
jgi:TolA-binding protein